MKGWLIHWYFVLFFLFFALRFQLQCSLSFSYDSSPPTLSSCPLDQSFALIQFNNSFSIDCSITSSWCNVSQGKTISWKKGTDCCMWDGVKCHTETGNVIGLDLSCGCLRGRILANSSLFLLHDLHELNLAYNHFSLSPMAPQFGQFTNLNHLNISDSEFTGQIPLEISHLSRLLSLDLSYNYHLIFDGDVFGKVVANLTQLRDLLLPDIDMSLVAPTSFLNMSSCVRTLTLDKNRLQGKFPEDVFRFPYLQKFRLTNVDVELELEFPKTNWSGPLKSLQVSSQYLHEIPDSVGNLRSLEILDLSFSNLGGPIPTAFGNLTQLKYLDLQHNLITGPFLFSFSNLEQLTYLDISNNDLGGLLPISAFNLTQVQFLDFSVNNLEGPLPSQVSGLSRLSKLYLDHNFLCGRLPSWLFSLPSLLELRLSKNKLTGPIDRYDKESRLEFVDLQNNEIHGPIPGSFFQLVNLIHLDLSSNKLNGSFELDKLSRLNKLEVLSLSNNSFQTLISASNANYSLPNLASLYLSSCKISEFPNFVRNLEGLISLDLSYNIVRVIEAQMFLQLKSLQILDLSHNSPLSLSNNRQLSLVLPNLTSLGLSSCNLTEFPNFLTIQENLAVLDLSNNTIQGQITKQANNWGSNLHYLDLSDNLLTFLEYYPYKNIDVLNLGSNLLEGPLLVPPYSISVFLISKNRLSGEIPSSICDLAFIETLDLSDNNLSGALPECLGSGKIQRFLHVLDLHMNNFHGNIPDFFVEGNILQTLNLNNNDFDGPLPKSLVNCHYLEVLNLGNNKINDTFPQWLGTLPQLQVLVLRSNHFHGQIIHSENGSHFSAVRILDLSHNEFSGFLPTTFLKCFKGMMNLSDVEMRYMGRDLDYYQDSVIVTMKGVDIELERILTIFTTIDMSSNKFEGRIPEIVGNLTSLQVLNFSHNDIIGHIPSSLGNLAALESLDLSCNKLVGEIPFQLTDLNFLAVLNLSENQLVGLIPQGKQFNTFLNDSYGGNLGLCGFPVSKFCGHSEPPAPVSYNQEADSAFRLDWKFVMVGYGCGAVFGFSAGYIMLTVGKPKWLVRMVQRVGNKILRRLKKYHRGR